MTYHVPFVFVPSCAGARLDETSALARAKVYTLNAGKIILVVHYGLEEDRNCMTLYYHDCTSVTVVRTVVKQ